MEEKILDEEVEGEKEMVFVKGDFQLGRGKENTGIMVLGQLGGGGGLEQQHGDLNVQYNPVVGDIFCCSFCENTI